MADPVADPVDPAEPQPSGSPADPGAEPQPSGPPADPGAKPAEQAPATDEDPEFDDERDHTLVQLGISLLALPEAEVCPISPDNCEPGETSIAISLHNLYRLDDFGFGAGIIWAFGLRSDAAAGDADGALEREHSRSYFQFEGQFRYFLPRLGAWDWWVGATVGAVVIRDSWSVVADRDPYADTDFVGPTSQTLATEGLAVGAGLGGHWRFWEYLVFGTRLHYAMWFLPEERETTPTGDSASIAGRVDTIDFGLFLALWLPV